jgi:hypothetical protein
MYARAPWKIMSKSILRDEYMLSFDLPITTYLFVSFHYLNTELIAFIIMSGVTWNWHSAVPVVGSFGQSSHGL